MAATSRPGKAGGKLRNHEVGENLVGLRDESGGKRVAMLLVEGIEHKAGAQEHKENGDEHPQLDPERALRVAHAARREVTLHGDLIGGHLHEIEEGAADERGPHGDTRLGIEGEIQIQPSPAFAASHTPANPPSTLPAATSTMRNCPPKSTPSCMTSVQMTAFMPPFMV